MAKNISVHEPLIKVGIFSFNVKKFQCYRHKLTMPSKVTTVHLWSQSKMQQIRKIGVELVELILTELFFCLPSSYGKNQIAGGRIL